MNLAALSKLFAAYGVQRTATATVDAYRDELGDIPDPVLEAALTVCIRECERLPTVARIRRAAAELLVDFPTEAAALAQIRARIEWARRGAEGTPPEVAAPVAAVLEQVGGYYAFRTGEESIVVGQFGRLYREERSRAVRTAQLADMSRLPAQLAAGAVPGYPTSYE